MHLVDLELMTSTSIPIVCVTY